MVLKTSTVLSCLLPARFGFGSNQNESPNLEKYARDDAHPEFDPFRVNPVPDLSRARSNTAPSEHTGDIGESPNPVHRSPVRQKRSSFTTFFAFSSKRKHLAPSQSVPGRWLSAKNGQTDVHIINPSAVPSPLLADEEEYYYSYYTSLTPTFPSHPTSPLPDTLPSEQPQQDPVGNPDLDSHPSHTQIQHPYAYSTPLHSRPHSKTTAPSLRHATSQPFQHHPHHSRSDLSPTPARTGPPSSYIGHQVSQSQPQLKTSISTPNLASGVPPARARSVIRRLAPTKSKGQERWLSAETWWDALLSPSPRFKVKHTPRPRPHTANGRVIHDPVNTPVQGEPSRILGVTFPSLPPPRPRAASATSNGRPAPPTFPRSLSTTDLGQPSTSAIPHTSFQPALETLVDDPTPTPDHVSATNTELLSPEPPLSLEQVIDEGNALEQQRAQWKRQASRSIGNRHTRSFSRARSKSLSERHAHSQRTSEGGKAQLNLEFLAARSLLGSQSTMPTVHVIKPSNSSFHSKAYSHSHSHSAYSFTHTSHSRVNSHSHSHSLTTSNSSKSSRNPRSHHSRSGSWSRTALLKAGSLCGVAPDDSYNVEDADEKVPSSSRVDVQGTIHISAPTSAEGVSQTPKVSPPQNVFVDEVGIAFSSTPPLEGPLDLIMSGHSSRHQRDQENRLSSNHTHKSSKYAGPHRSTIGSSLPQIDVASNVSLRHRLPPRPTIYPPITPIPHPYRSALSELEQVGDKAGQEATSKVTDGLVASQPGTETTDHPHISLSHSDFERYGVGEALVYASLPRPEGLPEAKHADVDVDSSHRAGSPPEEQSPSCETVGLQHEESDTASMAMNNPPSLTSSTIQMVMSAFNNPDDLDEFQDLFYKPHPISGDQHQESTATVNQVPTDVRSSASSSPLTHLVRKLSEEVSGRRDFSQSPTDPIYLRSELQERPSGESTTKFVLVRSSSSPLPMEPSSQVQVPTQGGKESTTQPVMVIPEDVDSSYTASFLEGLSPDRENDTFGCPIKHGQFGPVTAPSPVQSPARVSTHLSIQDEDEADETDFPPVTKRYGLIGDNIVRSSFLTTSVVSQMSGLFDFPLPPSSRPGETSGQTSISHAYLESTPSEPESQSDGQPEGGAEMESTDGHTDDEKDECPSGDVGETLQALRMSRKASFTSHLTTFGGSDDMDFITQLHQT